MLERILGYCRDRLARTWDSWFLEERSSISLSLFRIATGGIIGITVLPTFLAMGDNYLSTAFREHDASLFPPAVLTWAARQSDGTVWIMAGIFIVSWLFFTAGFLTQWSAIVLQLSTYFFFARNSLHLWDLSFDFLIVTLSLMLATPYPGDSFSVDSYLRGGTNPCRHRRPLFIQRLLQLQIAGVYFYTGLWKCVAGGNWIRDNPYYFLIHEPTQIILKNFPWRHFLGAHPSLCYALGLGCVAFELSMPFWLFWPKTRPAAVAAGWVFHGYLYCTMFLPLAFTLFFPIQLLLFLDPDAVANWLDPS